MKDDLKSIKKSDLTRLENTVSSLIGKLNSIEIEVSNILDDLGIPNKVFKAQEAKSEKYMNRIEKIEHTISLLISESGRIYRIDSMLDDIRRVVKEDS